MRHFGDIRAIDRLGEVADFSLSHGAVELAAEQALADIGTFESESGSRAGQIPGDAQPLRNQLGLVAMDTWRKSSIRAALTRNGYRS